MHGSTAIGANPIPSIFPPQESIVAGLNRICPTILSPSSATKESEPGTYTGDGNRDIDFLGKPITVRSTDPNDPNIIAHTIIDCGDADFDPLDGDVDFEDFSDFAVDWLLCNKPSDPNCIKNW